MTKIYRRGSLFCLNARALSRTFDLTLRLYIDTGATRTIISEEAAHFLDLDVQSGATSMVGISGPTKMGLAKLHRLVVGERVVDNMEVAIVDLPIDFLADGLLGLDFLRRGAAGFDFDAGTLTLHD